MKFFSLLPLFLLLIAGSAWAQFPGNRGQGQQSMSGAVYGRILDGKSGKPVDAASVQFIQSKFDTVSRKRKDTVINGMLTRANGDFRLEGLPVFGNFRLKVSAIGFKTVEQKVAFEMGGGRTDMSQMLSAFDKDLGNIKLEIDSKQLDNVTVTGTRNLLQLGIDRKVFNVEKNLVSQGGTAVDVMRNVPSVQVDIDGNVTMRNNAPQIFVDGRPTTMTLDQIPADAIASVELITNPSAKFDASGGSSGILNIVLKKNRKVGYNGSLRSGIDSRARVNLGGDINIRQNKINAFLSGNFGQRKSISTGTTSRTTFSSPEFTQLRQEDKNVNTGVFAFMRGGMDYFINNRNTLSFSQTIVSGNFNATAESDIWTDTLSSPVKSLFNDRLSVSKGYFQSRNSSLNYKRLFIKPGKEWTLDVNYNTSNNGNRNNVTTFIGNNNFPSFGQLLLGGGNNKAITFQTDFTNPLTPTSKLEMGARLAIRKVVNANDIFINDPVTGQPFYIAPLSVNYNSTDQVYAAYTTYSNRNKNFGYQLGLRVESSDYEGNVVNKGQQFKIKFPVSLFPSVFLSWQLKNSQELQFNTTRRINRPNFFQLLPFTDFSDSLNLSRGNADLQPEFTYSAELSYQKTFEGNNSLLASAYFKYTDNLITRLQIKEKNPANNQDRFVNSFVNANSSYVTGLELIGRYNITKWWETTTNLNFYTSAISITDPNQSEIPQVYSFFTKLNHNFKLPKNYTIQVSADYQSKTVLPPGGSGGSGGGGGMGGGRGGPGGGMFGGPQTTAQGFIRPNYGMDLAFRKEFLKDKTASVSLSVNDIFRTRRSDIFSGSPFFTQDAFRRRDPQIFRLNFNWRFGKFDMSLFKRKNMRAGMEGMQDAQMQ